MTLKIHPGIGIARIGDSPHHFVGPETVDTPPTPAGGYRDDEGRIRRQAARFRLFDDASGAAENVVESASTTIQWTVALAGGTGSIGGMNQQVDIVVGGNQVAELRTDEQGNLLVLSLQVSQTSVFDGTSDGSVMAQLTETTATGTTTDTATPAWVCVVPPNFCPGKAPPLPYSYILLDSLVAAGRLSAPPAAQLLSFRREVYPAIRGRTSLTAEELLALPTTAARVAAAPFNPSSLGAHEGAYLHAVVAHYHAGEGAGYVNDWSMPTPLTPAELDRGPLSHLDTSCGGSGWELAILALGEAAIADASPRLVNPPPGSTVRYTGWRTDLAACVGEWAVVANAPVTYGYVWYLRGFMEPGASGLTYQEWVPEIQVMTSHLDFGLVERGSASMRQIQLELRGVYQAADITFVTLPERVSVPRLSTTTGTHGDAMPDLLGLPVFFTAETSAPLGDAAPGSLGVIIDGVRYDLPIVARIVPAQTTQIALALDCSISMQERGAGTSTKFDSLRRAVKVLADVANPGDGIAIAPFSDDALLPRHTARTLGGATDIRRQAVKDFVDGLTIHQLTSIGDGIVSARALFGLTPDAFDNDALLIVTDGVETAPEWIRNVGASIREDTFAIGIGTAANIDTDILSALAGSHAGYLLLTGDPSSDPEHYRLEKYLLQILAGATRDQVVLDPSGSVLPGVTTTIPIPVSGAEFRLDVIVVADDAREFVMALRGPDGAVRRFEELDGEVGAQIVRQPRVGLARVPVPLVMKDGSVWGPGSWQLLLGQRAHSRPGDAPPALTAALATAPSVQLQGKALNYAAVVNARSALRLTGHVTAHSGSLPGFALEASVQYAGSSLGPSVSIVAHVETPRGGQLQLPLEPSDAGRFFGRFDAVEPGIYAIRLRASGSFFNGHRFVRELALTPAITKPGACAAAPCEPREDGPGATGSGRPAGAWEACLHELCRRLVQRFQAARRRC